MPAEMPRPADRLARLRRYLAQDPDNPALLADTCDTALEARAYDQALACIVQARRLGLAPRDWTLRHLTACLGAGDLDAARELLAQLPEGDDGPDEAQALWLRAMHHAARVGDAWAWVQGQRATGMLGPRASGVAALLAIDADDVAAAVELADAAFAADAPHDEALLARATALVAQGETAQATALLQRVLARLPHDGRTWSMLGFAQLREGELAAAEDSLVRALQGIPTHIGSWHALGWTRLLRQDRAGARAAFAQALALDRNFAESQAAVGLLHALDGDAAQAEPHLRAAQRLDPHGPTADFARALLAGEAQSVQQVQALAARLLQRPGLFGRSAQGVGPGR